MDLAKFRQKASTLLAGFTTSQKVLMGLAAVAVVVGLLLFSRWSSRPDMAALFSDLSAADASAISEQLTAEGVPYELADAGTTIMVPRSQLYALRIEMSAAGLPSSGAEGYSLLDEQGITTTEFRQRLDYQRALEGELAKTIGAIEGVKSVSVHLVIPKDQLFAQDSQKATASVLVTTEPSVTLAPVQVQAITNLVASSVPGLAAEDITVADGRGVVLSAPGSDGIGVAATDAQTAQRKQFEKDLAESLREMIAAVVGPGKVVVRVSADLDFDQRATTSETFANPGGQQTPQAETTNAENYTGPGSAVGGVLGPDGLPTTAQGGQTTYTRNDAQRSFALDRAIEEVKAAPGAIDRLSVAVLLDSESSEAAQVADIERLVTAAAGITAQRGDVVQVTRLAFDTSAIEADAAALAEAEAARRSADLMNLLRTFGVILLIAVVLFVAWRAVKRARRQQLAVVARPIDLRDLEEPAPAELMPAEAAMELPPATDVFTEEELEQELAALQEPEMTPEAAHREAQTTEIAGMIDRQPEEVAALLRSWLADRRSVRR